MPRLSLWASGRKGADYKFIDRTVSEYFGASGTAAYVHLYLGPHEQPDGVYTPGAAGEQGQVTNQSNVTSIQDVLFLENRDRKYSDTVYELRAIYNVGDADFDLRQFGLFLQNDTKFIEFHLNDMIAVLGRKLMPGDVLELPHERDDVLLDPKAPAINKFYVVEDANRASDGYSATWWPHIWRVKVTPMPGAQEYADILDKQAQNPFGFDQGRIGDLMTSMANELGLNEAIVEQAKASVPRRYFETQHFYMVPGSNNYENPWIFAGDGVPPNGAQLLGSGTQFPKDAGLGEFYLRTDYDPPTLFRRAEDRWVIQEVDYRQTDWSVAHRLLKSFINNDATAHHQDGTEAPEKVNLSKAVRPRADF